MNCFCSRLLTSLFKLDQDLSHILGLPLIIAFLANKITLETQINIFNVYFLLLGCAVSADFPF